MNVIGEELCWPLLLVYEESRCTDFLRQVPPLSPGRNLTDHEAVLGGSYLGRDTRARLGLPIPSLLGPRTQVLAIHSEPLLHRSSGMCPLALSCFPPDPPPGPPHERRQERVVNGPCHWAQAPADVAKVVGSARRLLEAVLICHAGSTWDGH